jgi:hypothetical protein
MLVNSMCVYKKNGEINFIYLTQGTVLDNFHITLYLNLRIHSFSFCVFKEI